jgi:hypothetical protein
VQSVDQRRVSLHSIALESTQQAIRPSYLPVKDEKGRKDAAKRWLQILDPLPANPIEWKLALTVALHAALDTGVFSLGTDFFEAQDAAALAISLEWNRYQDDLKNVEGSLEEFIAEFPDQEYYLVCAALRQLAIKPERDAFYQWLKWNKELLYAPDFTLTLLSLNALYSAGGSSLSFKESDEE